MSPRCAEKCPRLVTGVQGQPIVDRDLDAIDLERQFAAHASPTVRAASDPVRAHKILSQYARLPPPRWPV